MTVGETFQQGDEAEVLKDFRFESGTLLAVSTVGVIDVAETYGIVGFRWAGDGCSHVAAIPACDLRLVKKAA